MDKERQFANILAQLQAEAKENGNVLTEDRIRSAYEELGLDESQYDLVFDYLKSKHIGIGAPVRDEDFLDKEELDYLQLYLDELKEVSVYSDGEKEAYTLSAMAGDQDAQKKLVEIFLPDVVEIAKLYAGQGVCLEDLIGEGNVALTMGVSMLGALEHASEAQGMLAKMIMDGMEEYISENAENSKQDEKILAKVNRVADKANELSEELRRKVTVDELARETGMSKKGIMDALRFSANHIESIEMPAEDTENN